MGDLSKGHTIGELEVVNDGGGRCVRYLAQVDHCPLALIESMPMKILLPNQNERLKNWRYLF